MFDVLRTELKYSVRGLARNPVFTLVAVLSLALGIGVTTAVFSVVNALQFRPLPYRDATRLVDVYEHHPTEVCAGCGVGTSYPAYLDLRRTARTLDGSAAYRTSPVTLATRDGAERRRAAFVSASMFPLLGVQPLHGRVFTETEDVAGGEPVAVIAEPLWRARFGGDPGAVGRAVRIDGELRTIIGVMPDALAFPAFAELWLPIAGAVAADTRADRTIDVVARLADRVSLAAARAEISGIGAQLARAFPASNAGWSSHVMPLRAELASDYLTSFHVTLGIVLFVLLVACANLANLLLARVAARRQELAVRTALGAARSALARHVLAESLLLSMIAAALGLLFAAWALDTLTAVTSGALPAWVRYDINPVVVLFACALGIGTGLVFGLLPALQVARIEVNVTLVEAARGRTAGPARTRGRNTMVAVQVAAALVLVFGAAFLTREFLRVNTFDPGYDTEHLYGAQLTLPPRYRARHDIVALADALVARLRASAGTADVALSSFFIPNWPGTPPVELRAQGRSSEDVARIINRVINITPHYFRTHGIPIQAGRDISEADAAAAPQVGIVNSVLAARLWPSEEALGRQIHLGGADDDWITVVGIVPSARTSPFARDTAGLLYLPFAQRAVAQPGAEQLALHLRLPAAGEGSAHRLRTAIAAVDPDVVVENVMSVAQSTAQWLAPVRLTAFAITTLGLFAVLLAAMGIYGLIAFTVAQRTPEIGLRIALGATYAGIMNLVIRQALLLTLVGLAFGSVGAFGLGRVLRTQFFSARGVGVADLAWLGLALLAVAALASWVPARRAARADPMATLRTD
jgi:predicted permease